MGWYGISRVECHNKIKIKNGSDHQYRICSAGSEYSSCTLLQGIKVTRSVTAKTFLQTVFIIKFFQ